MFVEGGFAGSLDGEGVEGDVGIIGVEKDVGWFGSAGGGGELDDLVGFWVSFEVAGGRF